jgi:UDPglucose 6-dehydrogenase/GDP-mannose 6-dehydrogenase
MKVAIVGSGYVGLVSAAGLCEKGHEVTCVDLNGRVVDQINQGSSPIHEQGLPELLRLHAGTKLRATMNVAEAVAASDVTLVTVGTPYGGQGIDLSQIRSASVAIGKALKQRDAYHVVAIKSTVVPGTTDNVVTPLLTGHSGKTPGRDFGVGVNPEFLREGEAVQDFLKPDRIVLGGFDGRTVDVLGRLYDGFRGVGRLATNNRTAEMIKYASNALFATMISFANEIGNLCATVGAVDVVDVIRGVHLDRRLSPRLPDGQRIRPGFLSYLEAGCGFGGSCFPKDVQALVAYGDELGSPMRLLKAVIEVNNRQPKKLMSLLQKHFPSLARKRVAVLGLAFKPGTDDLRASPAIPIVQELIAQRAIVTAYDPVAQPAAERLFGPQGVVFPGGLAETIENTDAIVVVTRWDLFGMLPGLLGDRDPQPLIVDGRRMLDKRSVQRYEGIGL